MQAPSEVSALLAEGDTNRWNFPDAVGTSRFDPGGLGTGVDLIYGFLARVPDYYPAGEITNFAALTTEQQAGAEAALAAWAAVANVTFTRATLPGQNADLVFGREDMPPGAAGYATPPSYTVTWNSADTITSVRPSSIGGDVWLGLGTALVDQTPGGDGFKQMLHEIGQALGLKHPDEGSVRLPPAQATTAYTVMADVDAPNLQTWAITGGPSNWQAVARTVQPQTPMLYDIAALQMVYGANTGFAAGNDTYGFAPNEVLLRTIWDGGGIDTIDLSNQTLPSVVNLTPGSFSSVAMRLTEADRRVDIPSFASSLATPSYDGRNNLAIAYGTVIENATGGAGDDTIFGNEANNRLVGGDGADRLFGWFGDDRLEGGVGDDQLHGDGGNDTLDGGAGVDFVGINGPRAEFTYARNGDGTVTVRQLQTGEEDLLIGVEQLGFIDAFVPLAPGVVDGWHFGTEFDDRISGTGGADGLFGDRGADTLNGSGGDDYFHIVPGDGSDRIDGGSGNDFAGVQAPQAGYTIAQLSASRFTLTAPDGSVDTLSSVEAVGFTDAYVGLILQQFTNPDGSTWNQGTYRADVMVGTANPDGLRGGAGADTLRGGEGNDYLEGEAGSDRLEGGGGNDFAWAGVGRAGVTLARAGDGSVRMTDIATGDVDTLISVEAIGFTDSSIAVVAPQRWGDFLEGSIFDDTLTGRAATDGIVGGDGADRIDGVGADDFIDGGSGADTILGGSGNDFLIGGAGADTFVFSATTGFDRVEDFQPGVDRLQLAPGTNYGMFDDPNGTWVSFSDQAGVLLAGVDHNLASADWVIIG